MKLHLLVNTIDKSKKRLGRGIGSGRGKTAGRGTKGQKARGKIPAGFIGGTLPIYKKLPYRRGHHRTGYHDSTRTTGKQLPVSLSKLSVFAAGTSVDLAALVEKKIVREKAAQRHGVKVVAVGEITKNLTVKLPVSSMAAGKIEKAGGKVVNV